MPNSIQYAYACSPEDTINWFDVRAQTSNPPFNHAIEPSIFNIFELHVPLMDGEIWSTDEQNQIIADRLNELGYFTGTEPNTSLILSSDIGNVLSNGYYSTECVNGIMQVVGGMLLQPDSATLLLAYGIANSIWLVPSVAGIGIAVYLVKRKL